MQLDSELKPGQYGCCINCHAREIKRDGKINEVSCNTTLLDGIAYLQPVSCKLPRVLYSSTGANTSINTSPQSLLGNHLKKLGRL